MPLAACAVHTPYPLGIKGRPNVTIAVAPAMVSAKVSDLSDIQSGEDGKASDAQVQIKRVLKKIRLGVDAYALGRINQRKDVYIEQADAFTGEGAAALSRAKTCGADVLLAVDVSGYGRVQRKWVWLMAGTGLVEGVGQGVATAGVTGNPIVGAGVALEEVASESLTWLGGSWLWNKYLAPVTLEGRMWRVRDGRMIWREIQFADSSDLLAILFGKKQVKKEDALVMSLKQAEDDLFDDLDRYLNRQILHPGK